MPGPSTEQLNTEQKQRSLDMQNLVVGRLAAKESLKIPALSTLTVTASIQLWSNP